MAFDSDGKLFVNIAIWVASAAILWLPGSAILRMLGPVDIEGRIARISVELSLGLAFWPLVFLWTSLFPLRWSPLVVRGVVAVAAITALFPRKQHRTVRPVTFLDLAFAFVLLATVWTRLRTIVGIVVPPWVDSVHHTMLIRLFLIRGSVPTTYDPFIAGATAFYHWGYHAIAATLCWFIGRTDPFEVAAAVLSFGQFLNALTPLFVYGATRSFTRNRMAAVVAAALAALVSYYPAYYVSWGRYTHLAGVLLLLGWIDVASRRPVSRSSAVLLAIVAAGLTLVHVRLAFFAVTFTIVLLAVSARRRTLLAGGALALLLLLPWIVPLVRGNIAGSMLVPSETDARWRTPSEVRSNLLWVPHTAELLSVATAGLTGMANIGPLSVAARVLSVVWWLVVLVAASRRRRRKPLLRTYLVLIAWTALTLAVLNGTHFQFATNTSAAITAFVPICIAAGALIAWVVRRRVAVAAVVAIAIVIGIATLTHVINPSTVIATDADIRALRWFRASTPPSAAIAGRVQPWYGGAFIGVDGAYWASVLTDRRSLPPPTLYGWSGTPESRAEMELFLARWKDEYPFVTRATIDEARHLGLTHVYFGRGVAPHGRIVYQREGIAIAELP